MPTSKMNCRFMTFHEGHHRALPRFWSLIGEVCTWIQVQLITSTKSNYMSSRLNLGLVKGGWNQWFFNTRSVSGWFFIVLIIHLLRGSCKRPMLDEDWGKANRMDCPWMGSPFAGMPSRFPTILRVSATPLPLSNAHLGLSMSSHISTS